MAPRHQRYDRAARLAQSSHEEWVKVETRDADRASAIAEYMREKWNVDARARGSLLEYDAAPYNASARERFKDLVKNGMKVRPGQKSSFRFHSETSAAGAVELFEDELPDIRARGSKVYFTAPSSWYDAIEVLEGLDEHYNDSYLDENEDVEQQLWDDVVTPAVVEHLYPTDQERVDEPTIPTSPQISRVLAGVPFKRGDIVYSKSKRDKRGEPLSGSVESYDPSRGTYKVRVQEWMRPRRVEEWDEEDVDYKDYEGLTKAKPHWSTFLDVEDLGEWSPPARFKAGELVTTRGRGIGEVIGGSPAYGREYWVAFPPYAEKGRSTYLSIPESQLKALVPPHDGVL